MSTPSNVPHSWLTVVMPSYRGEEWIGHALRSLAGEAADGIEVLLIDGGPTPAARDIAREFHDRVQLRIVAREDIRDWQGKTNFGVLLAQSPHVCLLSVDDVWLPGRAAAVRAWITTAPNAVLHLAPTVIVDRQGRKLGIWRCPLPTARELSFATVAERLLVQNFIASPTPVFRRDAWIACGGLDESLWYTADWDLWLKLSATGAVRCHPEITSGFRIHSRSLTMTGTRNTDELERQMRTVLERYLPRLTSASQDIEQAARASIAVNIALAAAAAGDSRGLWGALGSVLRLKPSATHRFLRDTRLLERVAPRLRARVRRSF
jgi:glycosyltransferase involved in cell wall biosynthesis